MQKTYDIPSLVTNGPVVTETKSGGGGPEVGGGTHLIETGRVGFYL